MSAIISRAAWGARAPRGRTTVGMSERVEVTLHYSTGSTSQTPRSIQNYHMDSRGWVDIGYNFLVDNDGNAYEGRGWNVQGAHAAPRNRQGIGVCFIGSDGMSDAAKRAVIAIYDEACRRAGRTLARKGHRDINSTSCPGSGNYSWWRSSNYRDVASGGGGGGSLLRRGDRGPDVRQLQEQLISLGYGLPEYGADGDFGAETEAAVKKFQRSAGLEADGIVGPDTRAALDDALEDDMPKHRRYEGRTEVELPPGSWRSVLMDSVADSVHGDKNDEELYSLVGVYEKDGAFYDFSVGLTIQDLQPGCEVQVRATEYEHDGDSWTIVRNRPIHSPAHVGGGGHFTYAWKGNLAAGRRVRVRVAQFGDTTARLTSATSDVFYWPR
ncbi:peptidoglycan recognition protein family protein [Spiractinospora alimapuensis]|uniref:peptidoglycan recognition protein family protein n=1 Tax=Spiractinospora alimapuensis TaxID=2820884 RepID=UPI001F2ED19D|nr:peptidoglycan-binding domain-containing protein [Spiractinospora alimapuensis]